MSEYQLRVAPKVASDLLAMFEHARDTMENAGTKSMSANIASRLRFEMEKGAGYSGSYELYVNKKEGAFAESLIKMLAAEDDAQVIELVGLSEERPQKRLHERSTRHPAGNPWKGWKGR